ncbi:MAG: hypothetical protein M1834_008515 [Cirrosporium novae-zelandiae]|nr:MAG: hypothetical protein M1834_008515 [Cirrosporium novae-zelandiae]
MSPPSSPSFVPILVPASCSLPNENANGNGAVDNRGDWELFGDEDNGNRGSMNSDMISDMDGLCDMGYGYGDDAVAVVDDGVSVVVDDIGIVVDSIAIVVDREGLNSNNNNNNDNANELPPPPPSSTNQNQNEESGYYTAARILAWCTDVERHRDVMGMGDGVDMPPMHNIDRDGVFVDVDWYEEICIFWMEMDVDGSYGWG